MIHYISFDKLVDLIKGNALIRVKFVLQHAKEDREEVACVTSVLNGDAIQIDTPTLHMVVHYKETPKIAIDGSYFWLSDGSNRGSRFCIRKLGGLLTKKNFI